MDVCRVKAGVAPPELVPVKPLVDATLTAVTVPEDAGAVDAQVEPVEVNTLPLVPGATNKGVDVPLPKITLLAVRVVKPVPPFATCKIDGLIN